ncbi:DUF4260 family protein [Halorubrum sp. Atlit-8R]|uniref:DUF4260 domain-containing protein n=1 Tax=unclassified Halorubrum TaxID=2642239 RepID=UPI000EF28414|nr:MULTISPECIES: DUF4260 domain-containing protein [unclassified Halorubrum]RLM68171.1 DUF4260 family protein [Halorubrum sp. Atlit-9R]RLM81401.1 DUF4260 family protein [Halorubrum sp. Atlit-8R]
MQPIQILRLEGAGLAAVATATYFTIGGPIWLFVVLALAPDVSMLAYLGGARVGSTVYNVFHTYLAPAALGVVGVWFTVTPLTLIALVWAAHIGVDRAVGYGLKYPTGFKHTHLSGDTDDGTPAGNPAELVSSAAGKRDD